METLWSDHNIVRQGCQGEGILEREVVGKIERSDYRILGVKSRSSTLGEEAGTVNQDKLFQDQA
jgi:hypothetical protein